MAKAACIVVLAMDEASGSRNTSTDSDWDQGRADETNGIPPTLKLQPSPMSILPRALVSYIVAKGHTGEGSRSYTSTQSDTID